LAPSSVVHCVAEREAIRQALLKAFALDCRDVLNPFGDGHSAERILEILRELPDRDHLKKKHFHFLEKVHG
jgi:UDP-N-acetylglucosamine 2-epimerase (non-hydrolysing)/GDP/UDP-N,N'-diacetylbacillosamine 2-epimerase (hydrolysing)